MSTSPTASFSAEGGTQAAAASAALGTGELPLGAQGAVVLPPLLLLLAWEPLASPGLRSREGRDDGIPHAAAQGED